MNKGSILRTTPQKKAQKITTDNITKTTNNYNYNRNSHNSHNPTTTNLKAEAPKGAG